MKQMIRKETLGADDAKVTIISVPYGDVLRLTQEAREARMELEHAITELVSNFEKRTNLAVRAITQRDNPVADANTKQVSYWKLEVHL